MLINSYIFADAVETPVLEPVLSSLAAWWDFDRADGTVELDKHGTNDLTSSGTLLAWNTAANSKKGQSSRRVTAATSASRMSSAAGAFDYTNSSFTVFGWVKSESDPASSSAWQHVWGRYDAVAGDRQYVLRLLPSGQISFLLRDTSEVSLDVISATGVLTLNTWHFIESVFDWEEQEARIYVDRSLVASLALTGDPLQSNGAGSSFTLFHRNTSPTTNQMIGSLDAIGIYEGVLTGAQSDALYASGSGLSYEQFRWAAGDTARRTTGAWTWFNDPRAIALPSGVAVGSLTMDGAPTVTLFPDSGDPIPELRLRPGFQFDDHDNPALLRRSSDNKIIAIFSAHPGSINVGISTNADDVSAFGTFTDIRTETGITPPGVSYANPFQLTDETDDPIHMFMRYGPSGGDYNQKLTISTDQGATWGTAVDFITGSGAMPYLKVAQNGGGRLDFLVTDTHPELGSPSVYHCYYEGGNYYTSDGTLIAGGLPLDTSDMTLVYDGSVTSGWIWDIQIYSGEPVILYATFPTTSDHRYNRAVWNGSAWVSTEVCAAGGSIDESGNDPNYSGGCCLDPDDMNIVYASREVSGQFQIYRHEYNGSAWSATELVNSSQKKFRPYVPLGTRSLLYCEGEYTSYTDFRAVVKQHLL